MEGRSSGRQGFASMTPEQQRAIASKGGREAHRRGTAHEWTPEEAREAGRKGGAAAHRRRGPWVSTQANAGANVAEESK